MNAFLNGFVDEITKEAGIARSIASPAWKVLKKHPFLSLMGGSIVASTALSAAQARREGLRGGEKGRYLHATRDSPSRAAFTNYHQLFKHKPSKKQVARLSKHHKPSRFASYRSVSKPKKKKQESS